MKYMKRSGVYKASNVTFDPKTVSAISYNWWKFVAVIDGKVIFNNYRYSVSTSRHQRKIRRLLNELRIKIDIEMPVPKGLQGSNERGLYGVLDHIYRDENLSQLIQEAEEYLCNKFLNEKIKSQENYQKRKEKNRLENLKQIHDKKFSQEVQNVIN